MKEIRFTVKVKFNGEVSEEDVKNIMEQTESILVYGHDIGIFETENDVNANKVVISEESTDTLLIKELK